jgi:hypothetical protein
MKKDVSGDYVLFSDVDAAMDLVGQLSDRADNFAVAGSDIPLSDDMHRRQLIIGMEGLRDELRSIVRQVTGSNPWVK